MQHTPFLLTLGQESMLSDSSKLATEIVQETLLPALASTTWNLSPTYPFQMQKQKVHLPRSLKQTEEARRQTSWAFLLLGPSFSKQACQKLAMPTHFYNDRYKKRE